MAVRYPQIGAADTRPTVTAEPGAESDVVFGSPPTKLSDEDKLDALRYLDEFHFWQSLDDRRLCQCCKRSITGRQIMLFERKGTRGGMRLQCPSAGCVSTPSDWACVDPALAARLRRDFRLNRLNNHSGNETVKVSRGGQVFTVQRPKQPKQGQKDGARDGRSPARNGLRNLRSMLALVQILRPMVTGWHGIQPVS